MENKKLTIDDLARMVQGGFSDMKEDMDEIKIDIHNLKTGQKQILEKLEGVDKERIDGIDERVKNIEDLFAMPAKK
jgi:hypothetical protein